METILSYNFCAPSDLCISTLLSFQNKIHFISTEVIVWYKILVHWWGICQKISHFASRYTLYSVVAFPLYLEGHFNYEKHDLCGNPRYWKEILLSHFVFLKWHSVLLESEEHTWIHYRNEEILEALSRDF